MNDMLVTLVVVFGVSASLAVVALLWAVFYLNYAIRDLHLVNGECDDLRSALSDLYCLCENANEGAFRNGVTDYSNTMDEGEVLAWKHMDRARALLKEADQ